MPKCYPIFSEEDADLSTKAWRDDKAGYARRTIHRKPLKPITVFAHHDVCMRAFGRKPDWSKKESVDHINRNKLDNRRENLRICSLFVNIQNRPHKSKYSYTGFEKRTGKWMSRVKRDGVLYILGNFYSRDEAAKKARDFINDYEKRKAAKP